MSAGAHEGGDAPPAALPASRLAELRRERADRLVRLRGGPDASGAAAPEAEPALAEFLRALRAAIEDAPPAPPGGAMAAAPAAMMAAAPAAMMAAAPPAAVLPFQRAPDRAPDRTSDRAAARPAEAADPPDRASARAWAEAAMATAATAGSGDLDRLPGAGPGLVWALEQAGIARLADLADQAPAPLADRLGPLGGLIDLPGWIAFARSATGAATGAGQGTGAPPA